MLSIILSNVNIILSNVSIMLSITLALCGFIMDMYPLGFKGQWLDGGKGRRESISFPVSVQRMMNDTRNSCSALETMGAQLIPTVLPSQQAPPETCQVKTRLCALSKSLEPHLESRKQGTSFASLLKSCSRREEIPGRNVPAQGNICLGA